MVGGVRLFAGGGIVEGSIPEEEWMETEAKIDAIKATLA
jgi:isochorismate synthase EntC